MNVERKEGFSQVCVWPGTVIGADDAADFEAWIAQEFNGTRVQYLEEIVTNANDEGPGGRNDAFFAVHSDDIGKFAVARLAIGIRWLEDVMAECNNNDKPCELYPARVAEYKTW